MEKDQLEDPESEEKRIIREYKKAGDKYREFIKSVPAMKREEFKGESMLPNPEMFCLPATYSVPCRRSETIDLELPQQIVDRAKEIDEERTNHSNSCFRNAVPEIGKKFYAWWTFHNWFADKRQRGEKDIYITESGEEYTEREVYDKVLDLEFASLGEYTSTVAKMANLMEDIASFVESKL